MWICISLDVGKLIQYLCGLMQPEGITQVKQLHDWINVQFNTNVEKHQNEGGIDPLVTGPWYCKWTVCWWSYRQDKVFSRLVLTWILHKLQEWARPWTKEDCYLDLLLVVLLQISPQQSKILTAQQLKSDEKTKDLIEFNDDSELITAHCQISHFLEMPDIWVSLST